jgi:hypothetical protein
VGCERDDLFCSWWALLFARRLTFSLTHCRSELDALRQQNFIVRVGVAVRYDAIPIGTVS